MYPGYLQDRKYLGFAAYNDTNSSVLILKISKNQIRKIYVYAILIFSISTTILPVAGTSFVVAYSVPQHILHKTV